VSKKSQKATFFATEHLLVGADQGAYAFVLVYKIFLFVYFLFSYPSLTPPPQANRGSIVQLVAKLQEDNS